MLLPKFSIRWLLALTFVCALIFIAAKNAIDGNEWAIAIVVCVLGTAALMLSQAIVFMFVSVVVRLIPVSRKQQVESPFAADRLPPQVVPSRDAEAR